MVEMTLRKMKWGEWSEEHLKNNAYGGGLHGWLFYWGRVLRACRVRMGRAGGWATRKVAFSSTSAWVDWVSEGDMTSIGFWALVRVRMSTSAEE